jgi:putative spermidine/putrescine transport system ATP-binding protein
MGYIEIERLEKRFGAVVAVRDFDLEVARDEMVALLGPSGCGKSTTLRMIAGLDLPDAGRIRLDGQDVTATPPHRRRVGMVFQEYALFPNMTVAENIQFGPMIAGTPAPERARRVRELAELTALQDTLQRYPHQLSGGQRQRVALARALATEPRVLLLDEPLSALDAPIRQALRAEIRRIQQQVRIATIYVTHDQEEALALADRVVVMEAGGICEVGAPAEIYQRPRSAFTAAFIGSNNILDGVVVSGKPPAVRCGGQVLRCASLNGAGDGAAVTVVIPAEHLTLSEADPEANRVTGTITLKTFHGPLTRIELTGAGQRWLALLPSPPAAVLAIGDPVSLSVPADACHVIVRDLPPPPQPPLRTHRGEGGRGAPRG